MTSAIKPVKKTSTPKPNDPSKLRVIEREGESQTKRTAELGLSPVVVGAITAARFAGGAFGSIDVTEAVAVTRGRISKMKSGDMSGVEATLMAQAMTLDSIFNELARRAALNMGEHLGATETYLKMAFKAQSQCRSTLETLAEVKAPRVATFIKQANIANQQQVNNGGAASGGNGSPAPGENIIQSNELLEAHHGKRLDTRAQGKASGANPHLEAVGAVNGANNG